MNEQLKNKFIPSGNIKKNERSFSSFHKDKERREKRNFLEKEILETKRVVKVTKGGRRFSFTGLVLVKNPEDKSVAYSYVKSKEMGNIVKKSIFKAKKKLSIFFSQKKRTIPTDITVKYKATKLFLKPTAKGQGIKASSALSSLFKFLEIKDVTIKILGSRNKTNVVKAAFLALDKLINVN